MSESPDFYKPYGEAANNIRHYSNAGITIKIASIAQGVVLLSAWAVAINQKSWWLAAFLPILGIWFTYVLFCFFMYYYRASAFFYGVAAKMERTLFSDDTFRPYELYYKFHGDRYASRRKKLLTLHAPFILMAGIFGMALIFTFVYSLISP